MANVDRLSWDALPARRLRRSRSVNNFANVVEVICRSSRLLAFERQPSSNYSVVPAGTKTIHGRSCIMNSSTLETIWLTRTP